MCTNKDAPPVQEDSITLRPSDINIGNVGYTENSLSNAERECIHSKEELVDLVVKAINKNELTTDQLAKLLFALGRSQMSAVQNTIDNQADYYKNVERLADANGQLLNNLLSDCNTVMKCFLTGITGVSDSCQSKKKKYGLIKVIEQLHYTKDLTYVPLFFSLKVWYHIL